ncbi:MAG: glycosyltransferase involved in cell wall biosynthesis [Halieaceae bacterium]|jgi:glycosyltransferase involved in cell wall biosynthesis
MSITIITPVWNNADTIAQCISSINAQAESCQHILVDGGSTDGTLEIIEQQKAPDAVLISEPDQGMYDAINKGLKLSTCDIVGVLNSDDFYPTDDILGQVDQVFSQPAIDASYGDLHYVDKVDTAKVVRNWRSGDYKRENFFGGWMPPHPTFFLRRRLYEGYGGYRLDMGTAADYELMLRMLFKHEAKAAYIPQVMVHMRNDGMSNASLKNRIKANRNDRKAWRVNEVTPKPWTLIAKPLGKAGQWLSKP